VAGTFEIVTGEEKSFFFRLTADDGTVVAVSPRFKTLKGVAAGINAVRENAATGLVVNRSCSEAASG
jgi:uncharacterized protein